MDLCCKYCIVFPVGVCTLHKNFLSFVALCAKEGVIFKGDITVGIKYNKFNFLHSKNINYLCKVAKLPPFDSNDVHNLSENT